MTDFDYSGAIARIPRWLLLLATIGTLVALLRFGVAVAGGFLLGALAAWVNLKLVERAARRVTATTADATQPARRSGARGLFIQFSALILGAFVIIFFSGFSKPAAFIGFFTCPAAVLLEILYELMFLKR